MRTTHDAIRRLLEDSLEYVDNERARRDIREALNLLDAMDVRDRTRPRASARSQRVESED
jgi:hypothetical protein